MEQQGRFRLFTVVTLIASLALTILPLPGGLAPFKPAWAAVTLIYWAIASPRSAGFLLTFLTGLALDALVGSLLGQHALALLLVVYVARKFYLQLRAFPVPQLILVVAGLLAIYQFLLFWIDGIEGRTVPAVESWAPILSGTVLWALIWSGSDRGRDRAPARL